MKLIYSLIAFVALSLLAVLQSGCSAGASVRHDEHRHGVGVSGSSSGPGVSAGVRAY